MTPKNLLLNSLFIAASIISCDRSGSPKTETSALESKLDSLINPQVDSAKFAGVAVAVYRDGKPLLLKSYGYADVEHSVKLSTDASFEIGSVTKQFTSVATLQLVEAGKLSLDDDFTKYVKFDTKGRKISIRQLMNHTSGIKGYTELPFFEGLMIHKYKRDTLMRLVEKEKFDFEPGEALIYNNTAFFILGLVIEKVSGVSYEEYIKKNIFDKVGMRNSYYCDERKTVKNRAHGYDMGESGLMRAQYIDHTWPYAAGSLCSTVEDLAKWNYALHNGKVLSEAMYKELISPVKLNNGSVTRYADGLTVTDFNGKTRIEHGGGIPGFLSENAFFPGENISVTVLMNTIGPNGPGKIADFIEEELFPKGPDEPATFSGDLSKYVGVYSGRSRGFDLKMRVTSNDTTLFIQRNDDKPVKLEYDKDSRWKNGLSTYEFVGGEGGVKELRNDDVYGYLVLKKDSQ
ncbi:MAG TPA: serine hydrolase domain-containing protein [Cyclobacteriaceae bacterium]|nr:serine hydrolase domain-containing protein [Cyclobacteriaceae bacterium]